MNNDLISREVLKGLISDKSIPIKFEEEKRGDWQNASGLLLCDIYKIIDNAPTVEKPIRGIAKVDKNGEIEIELINPQDGYMKIDLAKKVIAKFAGYLDEDMIERIQIALEKENAADMKGGEI